MSAEKQRVVPVLSSFLSIPWYVNILIGEAALFTCIWVLPVLVPLSETQAATAGGWLSLAWLIAGVFLLLGVLAWCAQKVGWPAWHPERPGMAQEPEPVRFILGRR